MTENDRLNNFIKEVASEHGITVNKSEYRKFTKLKCTMSFSNGGYDFRISDYLSSAPDDVLKDYLKTVILNLDGRRRKHSPEFMNWLLSKEFISHWRPAFIQRSKNISRSTVGQVRELGASLDRLIAMGLVFESDLDNAYYTWTARPNYRRVGECNLLLRVVTISSALDSENVPKEVLDYVVYHETIHLRRGYRPSEASHGKEFKRLEKLYPNYEQCIEFISKNLKRK